MIFAVKDRFLTFRGVMKLHEDRPSLDRLIEQLDLVVREQVGEALADTMQRIRRLAIERRAGLPDAESRLIAELQRLPAIELRPVIRWLSLFFDMANVAEERQRITVLEERNRIAQLDGIPRGESIAQAVLQLKDNGLTAAEMQRWLDRLLIEPVFTAHPSEAKRRTTRQVLRRIRQLMVGSTTQQDSSEMLANMTVLWQSDLVRPDRPPVMSEVSRGVYFASTLWDVVPQIYRELRQSLGQAYPEHHFEVPSFLSFGTWIGGDRDGHPFVTTDVSRKTFARLRRAALEGHLVQCRRLHNQVVMSDQQVPSDQALRDRLDECGSKWTELSARLEPVSRLETYRRFVRMLEFRLERTLDLVSAADGQAGAYDSVREFRSDFFPCRIIHGQLSLEGRK